MRGGCSAVLALSLLVLTSLPAAADQYVEPPLSAVLSATEDAALRAAAEARGEALRYVFNVEESLEEGCSPGGTLARTYAFVSLRTGERFTLDAARLDADRVAFVSTPGFSAFLMRSTGFLMLSLEEECAYPGGWRITTGTGVAYAIASP